MPQFEYTGRDAQGGAVAGVLEGPDRGTVADQLHSGGIIPIHIRAAPKKPGRAATAKQGRISMTDVILFSRQMNTLLKAGMPMLHAFAGLRESAANKAFAEVLRDVHESLGAGLDLSSAMMRHPAVFSYFYVSLIQVGESTGALEEAFERLTRYLEFEKSMRDQVKAALRYPSFVVIAMAVAMGVINVFVIPTFAKVYAGFHAPLPLVTVVLIRISAFVVHGWPFLIGGVVAAFTGFRAWTRTARGRMVWDRFKLRIPVAGKIMVKASLARFARSFAVATRSAMPIVQGMGLVARVVDNAWIGAKVEKMSEGVQRGESITQTARAANVFTPLVLQMIAVGEEAGEMDQMLTEVADMYEREVEHEVRTLGAQIEPILIVVLGIMVLVLALGVFLPMWDMARVAMARH